MFDTATQDDPGIAPHAQSAVTPSSPGPSSPARRGLLRGLGAGAALAGAAAAGLAPTRAFAADSVSDTDILNFALNLEYLEAEYYLHAVYGHGLPADMRTGTGKQGGVQGGRKVNFAGKALHEYAREIAHDEHTHVAFLRGVLGSAAVAQPAIDLSTSFTVLARAAGVVGPHEDFDPFADENNFLIGAYIFEDVGVTAYLGAAPLISSNTYLSAAAGILAVEAYHAAEVRLQLYQKDMQAVTTKISALRAKLSGAADDQGVVLHNHANIVPTDSNSLAFARTTGQVLNIVYGGGSASNYLFFPKKMNGTIN